MTLQSDDPQAVGPYEGCPVFHDFHPLVPHHLEDPWGPLARAREEQPVFYMPDLDMWCVTRYEDIRVMLRDTETFSNNGANEMRTEVPEEITLPEGCPFPSIGDSIANLDPPRHTQVRKHMQYAFTPKRVAEFTPQLREIADNLIDGFIDDGGADLVKRFSNPFPIQGISLVLGFPPEEGGRLFRQWTDDFMELLANPGLPHDKAVKMWRGLIDCYEYLKEHVESRRAEPQNDLISDLLHDRSDGGGNGLSDYEVISNTISFVIAGTDTTATQISHMVMCLQEGGDRSRWEQVVADDSLIPKVVEETLRYLGPVRGLNRVVTRDAELGGVRLPKGSKLFWMGSSANRDHTKFEHPDTFDLFRANNTSHLGFGALSHFCIGAPLARLEARVGLERLVQRIPGMRVVQDQTVEYPPNFVMPGPLNLTVEW